MCRQGALWRKGCEIDTVSVSINNKLGHSKAAGRAFRMPQQLWPVAM